MFTIQVNEVGMSEVNGKLQLAPPPKKKKNISERTRVRFPPQG